MSRSRARSSNSVSLFPFLAVLVCAMGALIFLLIVTTQRIRSEAVARAAAERQEQKSREQEHPPTLVKPALPVPVSPSVVETDLAIIEPTPPEKPERIEPIPGWVELGTAQSRPVLPPRKVVPPPPPEPEPEPIWPAAVAQKPNPVDPNIPLRAQVEKLQAARQAWRDAVQKKAQTVAKLQLQVDSLTDNLKKINSQIEAVAKDRMADREAQRQLEQSRSNILGQLAKVQRQIEDEKNRAAYSPTKFQVVPFDGQTGTNYRPIIIECTAAGARFVPEDVLLTPDDFDGFTLGKNPMLAGARALSEYWSRVSARSGGKEPEPYVLLIVRPSGAKYYAARQLLEALDRPYGYELVEENLPLEIPPLDPVAAELCRNAVEEVLKERADLKKLIANHGPDSLNRNPNYRVTRKPGGGFEVEYAPNGKFAGEGSGTTQGPPRFGNPDGGDRFGQPRPMNANPPSGVREFGKPHEPGTSGSPLEGQSRPYTGGMPQITGTPSIGTGRLDGSRPEVGTMPQVTGDPSRPFSENPSLARTDSGMGTGTGHFDPNQPRLLPEEILRRSQGHLPYDGSAGNQGTPSPSDSAGSPGSQDPTGHSGNSQDASDSFPGEPSKQNQELPVTDPLATHGTGTTPSRQPNPNSENLTDPSVIDNSRPIPEEMALPNAPRNSNFGRPPSQGTPGTASGGQPQQATPNSAYEPPMPNFFNLNARRSQNQAEPTQRRWGFSDPRASIGFEREIIVRVEPTRFVVGNAFAMTYDARTTKEQLAAGMLEAVELTVRKWGRPPTSFYWVPTIQFQVGEAQVPVYRLLSTTAKSWGLETSAVGIEN